MRFPQLPQKQTTLQPMLQGNANQCKFYTWYGKTSIKNFFHVVPKRNIYDVFVNPYIKPISESMIGGNSNARVVTPGPIGMCTIKYPTKTRRIKIRSPIAQ